MTLLNKFCARLILWGSGSLAFVSGLVLTIAINLVTSLALLNVQNWPSNGGILLIGSFLLIVASSFFVLLASRVQPLKSKSDERLWLRSQHVTVDEQRRTTIEFIWEEVVNSEGKGKELQRKILIPFFVGIILIFAGFTTILYSLPIFSEMGLNFDFWRKQ